MTQTDGLENDGCGGDGGGKPADEPGRYFGDYRLPDRVYRSPEEMGPGYYFRDGELLVPSQHVDKVEGLLKRFGYAYRVKPEVIGNETISQLVLQDGAAVPVVVARIQEETRQDDTLSEPIVTPNHVLFGASHPTPLPGGPPRPTTAFSLEDPIPSGDAFPGRGVTVAVLDSGVLERHPWFSAAGSVLHGSQDVELPSRAGEPLPPFAGHGTHIAGVIRRHAPGASVLVRKVFDGGGAIDDATLERELRALPPEVDIVCLALGGSSQGDMTLPATASVLRDWSVDPELVGRVVVASAGNDGTQRPMWPAAFKRVIAVAALGLDDKRAPFSNYGWWVDACSTGVDIDSAFFEFVGPVKAVRSHGSPGGVTVGAIEKFQGFAQWDGTSFAAPRVAAALACAMSLGMDGPEAVHRLIRAKGVVRRENLGANVAPPAFF